VPVDPAIISSQLARPDKPAAEKTKTTPIAKTTKPELATTPTTNQSSFTATPEAKVTAANTPSSASRTASPQVKPDGVPNATATVERDVASAFKTFATQQRKNVEQSRISRGRIEKEIKLNDLKKFADSFKLHTPVPSDLVSIIAKDPAKQKEIQEKAKRNAEEAKANPSEVSKPAAPAAEAKPSQRPTPSTHGSSPSNPPSRQNPSRTTGFAHQTGYNNGQPYRGSPQAPQPIPATQTRAPGNLGARLRSIEQTKVNQMSLNPIPAHEPRLPPTGPANNVEPSFSRRSSGVASAQGGRLNPNSSEFRPSPHAATFNPNGNPSTGSSPRSAVNAPTPVSRSLLKRKPIPTSERPSINGKFNALEHIKTFKPGPEKNWKATGGLKPAYDTPPTWRGLADDEKPESTMHFTYTKLFEMAPFPTQTMSPPNPSHAIPQVVPHQHQLPFHLQQGLHNMTSRQSPRQPPMNLHGNQHSHGPTPPFNGHDDHRMMPSHSAQSFSPRLQTVPMAAYSSPMNQNAQMYNPQMIPYAGAPQMQQQYRSLSQGGNFMPPGGPMGPIMMQNPNPTFMAAQGLTPGGPMMFPQGGPGPFMPPGNGHPPPMPGVNGYPSPGRSAPMMMSQGSQQGHQQPMYGMNPGMSPGPQYGAVAPIYAPQPPGQSKSSWHAQITFSLLTKTQCLCVVMQDRTNLGRAPSKCINLDPNNIETITPMGATTTRISNNMVSIRMAQETTRFLPDPKLEPWKVMMSRNERSCSALTDKVAPMLRHQLYFTASLKYRFKPSMVSAAYLELLHR
jgi:hypothetical protein